jgi:hypothetical protein
VTGFSARIAALVGLALVNAIIVAWTNAVDSSRSSALARVLSATPRQVAAGLTVASLLPATLVVVSILTAVPSLRASRVPAAVALRTE